MQESANKKTAEEFEVKKQAEAKAIAERLDAKQHAEADRIAANRKHDDDIRPRAITAAKPETIGIAVAPTLTPAAVKIEKAQCIDRGNAIYQLRLWGWASGETDSVVWAGPSLPPGTGVTDEAKINCLGWRAAQPGDGPVYTRACARGQGNAGRTPWYSQTIFQWRAADSPSNAFARLRRPGMSPADNIVDMIAFSCNKS